MWDLRKLSIESEEDIWPLGLNLTPILSEYCVFWRGEAKRSPASCLGNKTKGAAWKCGSQMKVLIVDFNSLLFGKICIDLLLLGK